MLPDAQKSEVGVAWHFCGVEQKGLRVEESTERQERASGGIEEGSNTVEFIVNLR